MTHEAYPPIWHPNHRYYCAECQREAREKEQDRQALKQQMEALEEWCKQWHARSGPDYEAWAKEVWPMRPVTKLLDEMQDALTQETP